jgi:hypothetical protein
MQDTCGGKIDCNGDIRRRWRRRSDAKIAMINGAARYEIQLSRRRFAGLGRRSGRLTDDSKRIDRGADTGANGKKAKQDDLQRDCVQRQ